MTTDQSAAASDIFVRHFKWITLSLVLMLFAATGYAVDQRDHWNTWLFIWGIGLGLTGALHSELTYRLAQRVRPRATSLSTVQRRRQLNALMMLVLGVAIGIISGAADSVWYDAALTIVSGVLWVPATALAIALLRRPTA